MLRSKKPDARDLYLDLMQRSLTYTTYADPPPGPFRPPETAQTMVGQIRMANLRKLTEQVLSENIPGDLIETGVWRGGACIFMRAILKAHGVTDRRVIVADSFDGLPPPNPEKYPVDAEDIHHTFRSLAVPVEEVRSNFARYGLLDDRVVFVKGWFRETLPTLPVEQIALLRLDGDMYESTWDALTSLYDKVSPGGFVIVDDFGLTGANRAVMDFRALNAISEPVVRIDWGAVYWRKIVSTEDRVGSRPSAPVQNYRPERPRTKAAPIPPLRVRGLVPKLTAARLRRARPPRATLLSIYRKEHRDFTLEKVAQAEACRWDIRLWALDEIEPRLAEHTIGEGPGGRFTLLNRIARGVDWRDWIVIADDDTRIAEPWTLGTFLTVCEKFGFDLAQPAHGTGSYHNWEINAQKPESLARHATWVECGPILALSPRLRSRAIPFPETTRMGWGTEILWTKFTEDGYRLGIVDAVPLMHLAAPASTYDIGPELEHGEELNALYEFPGVNEFGKTLRSYRWLPIRRIRSIAHSPAPGL